MLSPVGSVLTGPWPTDMLANRTKRVREPNRLRSLGLDARAQFSSGSQVFSLSLTFFGQLPKPMNQPCPVKICVPVDYRPLVHV